MADKILPQQRQINRRADLPQIIEATLKMRPVGQHADAGGAMLLIEEGDLNRAGNLRETRLWMDWLFSPRQ